MIEIDLTQPGMFLRNVASVAHGGVDAAELNALGIDPAMVVDFSANQSPVGPSPLVAPAVSAAVVDAYPERDARPLASALAAYHGLAPAQVVVGNGSTELIRLIAQLALSPDDVSLTLAPSFGEYAAATALTGALLVEHLLVPEDGFALDVDRLAGTLRAVAPRVCWWCAPNNPTGSSASPSEIAALVAAYPETLFVLDEAYCDLLHAPQWTPDLLACGNLLVVRSMTKAWGLAGLRLGYVLGAPALIGPLTAAKPPWNVNACAQAAGIAALTDGDHYRTAVDLLRDGKAQLVAGLTAHGWSVIPSATAFFLVRVGDAPQAKRQLLQRGCLVRDCTSFGLPEFVRISPRLPADNERLLGAFATLEGCR